MAPSLTRARVRSSWRCSVATSSSATETSRAAAAASPYCRRTSAASIRSRSATANRVAATSCPAVCARPSRRKRREWPLDADRGQRVRPARLLAALDDQRGIRPQAGLLLLSERHVDLGPRGPQRRLTLEGERNRLVEADARALVQIRACRSAWRNVLTSHGRRQKDGREHRARESSTGRHCTAPWKLTEPLPAGPLHSMLICHEPAMPNSAVAA